jgi:hypothetical protein
LNGRHNITLCLAASNESRMLVNHAIPHLARIVIGRVTGLKNLSTKTTPESLQVSFVQHEPSFLGFDDLLANDSLAPSVP